MSIESVISLLTDRIGLQPSSLGDGMVALAIERRMEACGMTDPTAYRRHVTTSADEWSQLVEAVVIPETWFFRDWEPFVFLGRHAMRWLAEHRRDRFRVLSVPCSSGEEPYSIAMTFLDRLIPPERFRIDAADISGEVIGRAERAVYGPYSFREREAERFQDRYFRRLGKQFELQEHVRGHVHFRRGNLLDETFLRNERPYDAIFCRNMMIYFDTAARQRTLNALRRLLADDGVIFAGYAEAMIMLQSGFTSVDHAQAFAYRVAAPALRRDPSHTVTSRPASRKPASKRPTRSPSKSPSVNKTPKSKRSTGDPVENKQDATQALMDEARRLADGGHLEEAITVCESIVDDGRATAESYCLLGLIHEATGDRDRAEPCFDKALYLDPDLEEALVHLSLILELRGDIARATALKDRVQRIGEANTIETDSKTK